MLLATKSSSVIFNILAGINENVNVSFNLRNIDAYSLYQYSEVYTTL